MSFSSNYFFNLSILATGCHRLLQSSAHFLYLRSQTVWPATKLKKKNSQLPNTVGKWHILCYFYLTMYLGSSGVLKGPQGSLRVLKGPQGSSRILKGPQGSSRVLKCPQGFWRVLRGRIGSSRICSFFSLKSLKLRRERRLEFWKSENFEKLRILKI